MNLDELLSQVHDRRLLLQHGALWSPNQHVPMPTRRAIKQHKAELMLLIARVIFGDVLPHRGTVDTGNMLEVAAIAMKFGDHSNPGANRLPGTHDIGLYQWLEQKVGRGNRTHGLSKYLQLLAEVVFEGFCKG